MIFYAPNINDSSFLSEEESAHAIRVLRLDCGEKIELVDGLGNFYEAEIIFPHHKRCEVRILNKYENFNTFPFHLHIAIAPTKNMDRLEWFVEKATEIGISEITPLLCRYSERKVIKLERLNKILISAMKQSKKATLPILNEMISFDKFIKSKNYEMYFLPDEKGDIFQKYNIISVPTIFLINKTGLIRNMRVGIIKFDDFLRLL